MVLIFYTLLQFFLGFWIYKIILTKNLVHSLILLIVLFHIPAIFLFNFGLQFYGIFILLIYVGAISVLFLFILIMLNIKELPLRTKFLKESFILLNIIYLFSIYFLEKKFFIYSDLSYYYVTNGFFDIYLEDPSLTIKKGTDLYMTGKFMYTIFFKYFFSITIALVIGLLVCIMISVNRYKANPSFSNKTKTKK